MHAPLALRVRGTGADRRLIRLLPSAHAHRKLSGLTARHVVISVIAMTDDTMTA